MTNAESHLKIVENMLSQYRGLDAYYLRGKELMYRNPSTGIEEKVLTISNIISNILINFYMDGSIEKLIIKSGDNSYYMTSTGYNSM